MRNAIALLLAASVAHAAGVQWSEGTLEQVVARARAEKKWVLVDVAASWCGPCHEMDEKVYARDDVAAALAPAWIPLKRDGEVGDGVAIAVKYHVVGYPTLLLLDGDGAEVDRVMGFVEA